MTKIVFFTGAGMSRESGLPTFRGDGGIWNGRGRGDVKERRQAMLDFSIRCAGLARLVEMLTEYEKSRLSERL